MARQSRKRRYAEPHPELDVDAVLRGRPRVESGSDGRRWNVRNVAGSEKIYRCPGCLQEIAPGTAHVVAWGEDHLFGAEAALAERRHWHRGCWQARGRRGPR
ncbi:hypothetical protein IM660_13285 [Ruania alkalisoli]|uniref:ATP/GTP-binding protein n=1 Tax=Ruania alkalisoli TaxID=2779775 RepID=A0A7M1SQ30_9MICO|nr:hypothetical protein [Ruania alkalisoli]QOR69640.1 hypothetical protein IM660_13285 [Ruania alkalisoli]